VIISLRGANGSGKSTLTRAVMERYRDVVEISYPGRRRPVGQICLHPRSDSASLFVPGHYQIANGGIDTMTLSAAYELIERHAALGLHVLYEGHNAEDGCARLLRLRDAGHDCRVVLLDVPPPACVAAVRARGHRIAAARIRALHAKLLRDVERFRRAGVETVSLSVLSRDEALRHVRRLLDV
jgi:hypothetical protein